MKSTILATLFFTVIGYLAGSILFSELSMRLFHKKSLMAVSLNHNPGVSNAYRYGGFWCGTLALAGDILKGILPVAVFIRLCGYTFWGLAAVMIAPVLGHAFSCFWSFKGGMSITVSFGVLIGLCPHLVPLGVLIILFLTLLALPWFNNSLRSIFAFAGLAAACLICAFFGLIPWNVMAGVSIISCIVCIKMWPDLTEEGRKGINTREKGHRGEAS